MFVEMLIDEVYLAGESSAKSSDEAPTTWYAVPSTGKDVLCREKFLEGALHTHHSYSLSSQPNTSTTGLNYVNCFFIGTIQSSIVNKQLSKYLVVCRSSKQNVQLF